MSAASPAHVELPVSGMTCASCAARIERRLNRLEGVTAAVNYATERATVDYDPDRVNPQDLVVAVRAAGYDAALPAAGAGRETRTGDSSLATLRRRLIGSALLSVPVVALAMIPALQFDGWAWAAGVLATPVVWWGGWGFHQAAWQNLRHRTATMDTLISLGSLAAWGWSVVALLFLGAGDAGMRMKLTLTGVSGSASHRRGVLRGRRRGRHPDPAGPLPRSQSQAAGRGGPAGPARPGRQRRRRHRRRGRAAHPDRGAARRDTLRRPSGREDRHRRHRGRRSLGHRRVAAHRRERPGRSRTG